MKKFYLILIRIFGICFIPFTLVWIFFGPNLVSKFFKMPIWVEGVVYLAITFSCVTIILYAFSKADSLRNDIEEEESKKIREFNKLIEKIQLIENKITDIEKHLSDNDSTIEDLHTGFKNTSKALSILSDRFLKHINSSPSSEISNKESQVREMWNKMFKINKIATEYKDYTHNKQINDLNESLSQTMEKIKDFMLPDHFCVNHKDNKGIPFCLVSRYFFLMERDKTYQLLMRPLKSFKFFRMNYKAYSSLRKKEILSMFHLCSLSREELTNIPGLGTHLVNNIESFLKENNLQLGMDTKLYVQLHDELVELSDLFPSLNQFLFTKLEIS